MKTRVEPVRTNDPARRLDNQRDAAELREEARAGAGQQRTLVEQLTHLCPGEKPPDSIEAHTGSYGFSR